jgi:hypothetical protein
MQEHEAIASSYLQANGGTLVPHPVVMMRRSAVRAVGRYCDFLGYVRTARKYASRILARAPFSFQAWRLAYCAIRGY